MARARVEHVYPTLSFGADDARMLESVCARTCSPS